MAKKDPLDPLFEEMRSILNFLHENASRPLEEALTPEMDARLTILEEAVAVMKETSEKELKSAGIDQPLSMPNVMSKFPQMDSADKKAIETSISLGREAGSLYLGFLIARKQTDDKINKKLSPTTKKEKTKRKAKFKKTAGDQTWKKI